MGVSLPEAEGEGGKAQERYPWPVCKHHDKPYQTATQVDMGLGLFAASSALGSLGKNWPFSPSGRVPARGPPHRPHRSGFHSSQIKEIRHSRPLSQHRQANKIGNRASGHGVVGASVSLCSSLGPTPTPQSRSCTAANVCKAFPPVWPFSPNNLLPAVLVTR